MRIIGSFQKVNGTMSLANVSGTLALRIRKSCIWAGKQGCGRSMSVRSASMFPGNCIPRTISENSKVGSAMVEENWYYGSTSTSLQYLGCRTTRVERVCSIRDKKSGQRGTLNPEKSDMWKQISTSTKIFGMALFWVVLFFVLSAWDGKSTGSSKKRGPRK